MAEEEKGDAVGRDCRYRFVATRDEFTTGTKRHRGGLTREKK